MKRNSPTKHLTSSPLPTDPALFKPPEPIQLEPATQLISLEAIEGLVPLVDTPDTLCEKFTPLLTLPRNPKTDMRSKIERDFLLFSFFWAVNQGMHTEEISLFLGLIYDLYHFLEKENASKEGIVSELEDRMKGVGVEGYVGGYTSVREEQMKKIIDFVSISLVQHFHLYSYVLTEEREEEKYSQEIDIEELPDISSLKIAPLDESVPAAFFNRFINPQPIIATQTQTVADNGQIVSESKETETESKETETESKEIESEEVYKESNEEIEMIFEKFPPEKVKKALSIATERVFEEFKNEMKEKWNAKELEYQNRIKRIENKLKN